MFTYIERERPLKRYKYKAHVDHAQQKDACFPKTYQLFHLLEISPKRKKPPLYTFCISPNSIPITIHDFNRPPSDENIFHQSQRGFQRRKLIPGHEEAKSRLTGALDGARARPRNAKRRRQSLRESREAGGHSKEREIARFLRGHGCSSFARGFVCALAVPT